MSETIGASQRPITVLTIDDHPLLRDGIAAALADQPDMVLVGEAIDGPSGIEQFRQHRPDVTLMDLRMPGMSGIDALRILRKEFPDARVIVLTTYRGDAQVMSALQSGASGFLLKGMLRKDLRDTIRAVHAGLRIIPPEVASVMAEHVGDDGITPREIEVLNLVARGNSNREIAVQLGVSEDAIKAHMKRILVKLEAKDRTHAVMVALKRGILDA
ncbi:MAG: response regulator transcription factor [Steroidobacteraceae bacterium]